MKQLFYFSALLAFFLSGPAQAQPPNIVMILADDLGYGDLGCYGSADYKTPEIDQLASQGIRLMDCTASAPICSPSRAGLLTGRFPARFRILAQLQSGWNESINQADWLDAEATTLPDILKAAGYTTAIVGKWHLVEERVGAMTEAPNPGDYGFEEWELIRGPWDSTMQPTQVFDFAERYLRRPPRQPFFLLVTIHEPHVPYIPTPASLESNNHLPEKSRRYAASVADMDAGVGRLLRALDETNLADNTLFIFTSDNGPARPFAEPNAPHMQYYNAGSAETLRGHKGDLYEGGLRIPFIARWPGHIPSGTTDSTSAVSFVDMLPTLTDAAGADLPNDSPGDGESRLSVLKGHASARNTPLFWMNNQQMALRDGEWKLIAQPGGIGVELYNLKADLGESSDASKSHSEELERLLQMALSLENEMPGQPQIETLSNSRRAGSTPIESNPKSK